MEITKRFLLLLAFFEGGLVMLLELSVPHALAPVIGNSMNIWALLILLSVGGLSLGYLVGSKFSKFEDSKPILFRLLFFSLSFGVISFVSYRFFSVYGLIINETTAAYILAIISLFVPTVLLSATTPIIIKLFAQFQVAPGYIFSVSTFGGVFFTFITGFIILPEYGIMRAFQLFLFTITLLLVFCAWNISKKTRTFTIVSTIIVFLILFIPFEKQSSENLAVLELREGLNGQLLVTDERVDNTTVQRTLFINRMGQTMVRIVNGSSMSSVWSYPGIVKSIAAYHGNTPSKALILGLGGGIVPLFLSDKVTLNYSIDAVELNKDIIDIAQKHFYLPFEVTVYEEDARRFLNANETQYDFILMDVFNGEVTPSHVLSLEAFERVKHALSDKGFVVINFNGNISGELGIGGRSMYKTLIKAGFNVTILPTFEKGEKNRNNLFIASLHQLDLSKIKIDQILRGNTSNYDIYKNAIDVKRLNLDDAVIITDDYPMMEKLNQKAAKIWREDYLKFTTVKYRSKGVPLFK